MSNEIVKPNGYIYRGRTVADSWEIAIGTEDCRVYPYPLPKAKQMAALDHGISPKDVNWILMRWF